MPDAAEPVIEDTKGDHCPRCLQTVPAKARRCPGCGQPIRSTRSLIFAIGMAGLLVLLFAMVVMYKLAANEEAATAPVPVDENADHCSRSFSAIPRQPAVPTRRPSQTSQPSPKRNPRSTRSDLLRNHRCDRGQTGLPANFRQKAPEIHGSLVSPLRAPCTLIVRGVSPFHLQRGL